jgi:septal ring factor EnvC (AmiA/AmiB activator)
MQLEKVTNRSGQAALAGWISSNDVTLFTTVLVMAIAIFLHARLSKGAKENVQITKEKATLTQRLEATASELDASHDLLDKTRNSLTLTQEERDQLQKQLVDKLAALARLNENLDALLKEKGLLESQRQSLTATKNALTKEKADLITQKTTLAGDRDSLKTKNVNLREQLETITSQLEKKIAALEQVERDRDRLRKQTDELDAIVAGLKQKLEKLNIDLAETKTTSATAQAQTQTKVKELQSQLAQRDKTVEDYLAKLKRATEMFQGLTAEKRQLQKTLSESELKHQAEMLEESRNNRELVGLTGRLERVAILFDASGSMRQRAAGGDYDRWAEAQQIAGTWLEHLNVQKCVLIVFASDVRTFPEDGTLADVRGSQGKAKRDALLQHVKALTPGGWTNTYDALRTAYQYDIDSILLFSDGAPSVTTSGAFDPAAARQIYDLCRAHPKIPIHTIGLGNYFDQNASTFLMSLAKITNGTFRGN